MEKTIKQTKKGAEKLVRELEEQRLENQRLAGEVTELQQELLEVRSRTSSELAVAQDRLRWMDENHLGPEVVERRRYLRIFVRILNVGRYLAARLRKLKRA